MPPRTVPRPRTTHQRRGRPRPTKWRGWVVAGLVGVAVALAVAVAASNSGSGGSGNEAAVQVAAGGRAEPGERAPAFSVRTLDGGRFGFPTGKPTAIFFTASYCGSCIPKARAFARIKADVGERIAVLGIDIDPSDTPSSFREWIAAAGNPPFAYAMDAGSRLVRAFDVRALSTVVITDGSGKVVYRSFLEDGEQVLRTALVKAGLAGGSLRPAPDGAVPAPDGSVLP